MLEVLQRQRRKLGRPTPSSCEVFECGWVGGGCSTDRERESKRCERLELCLVRGGGWMDGWMDWLCVRSR